MDNLPQSKDENLLVGYNTSDDAGIYRISDELALVTTADFITPPVNDPYIFGQIAAANAISDVYAMGGEPKVCLNLLCFPSKILPHEDLEQIIAGALNKITEAGAVLAGGHSVEDDEPKFGLSVIGLVHPDKFWTNTGARRGDALVLTKPLGSGVLFNANLKRWVSDSAMQQCVEALIHLNGEAAKVMKKYEIHAVTDVTGFGLGGHALEMAKGSDSRLQIRMDNLPLFDEALAMYDRGMTTGVNRYNEKLIGEYVKYEKSFSATQKQIILDPQTSGGLLVALPADQASELVQELSQVPTPAAALVGEVLSHDDKPGLIIS
ncbi:MAG: selenide, water dikinase SelD [Desulfofustis sp.]|nr:selenide, water dikinase SelD [Desulfofustis sp.]